MTARDPRRAVWIVALGGAALVVGLAISLVSPDAREVEPTDTPAIRPGSVLRSAPRLAGEETQVPVPTLAGSLEGAPVPLLEATRLRTSAAGEASGSRLAGSVVREADGTPVVGARIMALARLDDARGGEPVLGAGVETDAEGAFEFPAEVADSGPAGFFVEWRCSDSGGFEAQQRIPLSADLGPPDLLSLRLDTGWILTVHVRDEAGRPVSGVYVRSRDANGKSDSDTAGPFYGPTERVIFAVSSRDYTPTGDSGDFLLCDLRWLAQPLPVVVFGEGFETNRFHVPTPPHGTWSAAVNVVLRREAPTSR